MTSDKLMAMYERHGYAPVPWSHHSREIKAELQRMRWVPRLKCCWYNSQRFALETRLDGVQYIEGWVFDGTVPFEHGWLLHRGRVLDLSWLPDWPRPQYGLYYAVARDEIVENMRMTGEYISVRGTRLNKIAIESFYRFGFLKRDESA